MTCVRPCFYIIAGFVLSVVLGQSWALGAEGPARPNVVLFLIDDQGWGATSVRMDDRVPESASDFIHTPNLEKLASEGIRFSNGYASHANCSPSRYSIMTGVCPAKQHATDIMQRFPGVGKFYKGNRLNPPTGFCGFKPGDVALPEWIKQHRPEYATAHFGKWHIDGGGPDEHGFDTTDHALGNTQKNSTDKNDPKHIFSITRRAGDWIAEQVKHDKPFYVQLSHFATHLPMQSRPETLAACRKRPAGKRHRVAAHAAMAEDLDTGVGQLLAKLDELGIRDNTYIIYTADNGTYPLPNPGNTNGPLHGWKGTIWNGGIRVPFIIAGPGIAPGQCDAQVVGYDLFPTICQWLGIDKLPKGVEGGSLASALKSPEMKSIKRPNDFLVFHWPHYQHQKFSQPTTAIFKDNYKLMKFYETGELRLYDLASDLAEVNDLSDERPELTKALHQLMVDYLASVDAGMPTPNKDYRHDKDPGAKYEKGKKRLMNEPYFLRGKNRRKAKR